MSFLYNQVVLLHLIKIQFSKHPQSTKAGLRSRYCLSRNLDTYVNTDSFFTHQLISAYIVSQALHQPCQIQIINTVPAAQIRGKPIQLRVSEQLPVQDKLNNRPFFSKAMDLGMAAYLDTDEGFTVDPCIAILLDAQLPRFFQSQTEGFPYEEYPYDHGPFEDYPFEAYPYNHTPLEEYAFEEYPSDHGPFEDYPHEEYPYNASL
jgi:hypothetical protein